MKQCKLFVTITQRKEIRNIWCLKKYYNINSLEQKPGFLLLDLVYGIEDPPESK